MQSNRSAYSAWLWAISQKRIRRRLYKEQLNPEAGIFFKPCVLWDYKEKEEKMLFEVIWSLGATSNLTQFYFKVEVK